MAKQKFDSSILFIKV